MCLWLQINNQNLEIWQALLFIFSFLAITTLQSHFIFDFF
jgi:hypothetical protein